MTVIYEIFRATPGSTPLHLRELTCLNRIPDKVEISGAAPLASEQGHWTGIRKDGTTAYGGAYLAMWRKTGDAWKLRSELFVVLTCDDNQACAAYRKEP